MDRSFTTADWSDILTVLRETHRIWSPGLTKELYKHYIWRQISHPWGRRNFRFMVLKRNNQVISSCKLYRIELASRGKKYQFTGIGSVYTQEQFRNQGLATELINLVIDLCKSEDQHGLLLFSDIGTEFYEHFGFIEFGSAEFAAYLNPTQGKASADSTAINRQFTEELSATAYSNTMPSGNGDLEVAPEEKLYRYRYNSAPPIPIEPEHIPALQAVYNRWNRSQPFALVRDPLYWSYKLGRERFLSDNSFLSWPRLSFLPDGPLENLQGYAIVEQGGNTLRILEIAGSHLATGRLWQKIFAFASATGLRRVRGWEAVISDLGPSFSLAEVLPARLLHGLLEAPLNYNERDWGRAMMLLLSPELDGWSEIFPCPLLELDHL